MALKEIRRKAGEYIEKKLIVAALEKTGGNRRKASKALKISYRYLLHKIDQLDIDSPAWSI